MIQLLRRPIQFLYPSTCPACQQPIDSDNNILCPACHFELLELQQHPACPRCAMPLPAGSCCPHCLGKGLRPYRQIARLGIFTDPLKPLIHDLKYHRNWPVARTLARRLFSQPHIQKILSQSDLLVPVPLHWRRQFHRGYNQSHELARHLSRLAGIPVLRAGRRLRDTPTQTRMKTQSQRRANMRNAFALTRATRLQGLHITVIDDVMTTGSTLRAFGRILAQSRPASLSAITLAIADPKGRGFEAI